MTVATTHSLTASPGLVIAPQLPDLLQPVKVRRGELSVHLASEDPVLRGDSQDRVDRENFLREMQWGSPFMFFNFDGMRIQGLSLQRIT